MMNYDADIEDIKKIPVAYISPYLGLEKFLCSQTIHQLKDQGLSVLHRRPSLYNWTLQLSENNNLQWLNTQKIKPLAL